MCVQLADMLRRFYNPRGQPTAHWCSWLTRCPLKAEITGSSPVCAANSIATAQFQQGAWVTRFIISRSTTERYLCPLRPTHLAELPGRASDQVAEGPQRSY